MNTEKDSSNELITIKETAKLMACSTMTVRRRMGAGELGETVKDGRKFVRLYRRNVLRYIQDRTTAGVHHE